MFLLLSLCIMSLSSCLYASENPTHSRAIIQNYASSPVTITYKRTDPGFMGPQALITQQTTLKKKEKTAISVYKTKKRGATASIAILNTQIEIPLRDKELIVIMALINGGICISNTKATKQIFVFEPEPSSQ